MRKKMNNIKISVIIPCYNLGRYINEAIDSVLKQSLQNLEVIVVDDGSSDEETKKILDNINHPKVRLIRKFNQGLSITRNIGIKEARSPYICCLDADDKIAPTYLEKACMILDKDIKKEIGFVTPWVQLFENSKNIWETSEYNPAKLALNNEIAVASVFRKESWERVNGYNQNMKEGYEDWNFWISICSAGYIWKCIREPLFFYRVRNNSMISKSRLYHEKLYRQIILNNREFFLKNLDQIVFELKKNKNLKNLNNKRVLFRYAINILKKNGPIYFFQKAINYFKNPSVSIDSKSFIEEWFNDENDNLNKNDLLTYSSNDLDILFIIPGTSISGGIAVVLKHANMLKEKGYNVMIVSQDEKEKIDWFPNQNVQIIPWKEELIPVFSVFNLVIATSWTTAPFLDKLEIKKKIYFVQSDERRFISEEHIKNIINKTYKMEVLYMTEATWIQRWLKEEFGHNAYYVPNGIDLNIFHKTKPLVFKKNKPRVLIEGSINVPFKGMDDAYSAVKDLDCELWIVSSNGKPKDDWKYDKFFEGVPFDKMREIYSSCDIFLKMSRVEGFFGPPMEAMACGCSVVVGKVTGYDEYIENEKNALVVEQGDVEGAKKSIRRLLSDNDLRKKLIVGGYETVKGWDWERSARAFEYLICEKNEKNSAKFIR